MKPLLVTDRLHSLCPVLVFANKPHNREFLLGSGSVMQMFTNIVSQI